MFIFYEKDFFWLVSPDFRWQFAVFLHLKNCFVKKINAILDFSPQKLHLL